MKANLNKMSCTCENSSGDQQYTNSSMQLKNRGQLEENGSCPGCLKLIPAGLNRRDFFKIMGRAALFILPSFPAGLYANGTDSSEQIKLAFTNYGIFFDQQDSGHAASSSSVILKEGVYFLLFQKASDAEPGINPKITYTITPGLDWSEPRKFGPDIIKNTENEFLGLRLFGPTRVGTILSVGVHVDWSKENVNLPGWRPGTLIIGRKTSGARGFTYDYHKSGAFLGEQFVDQGILLRSGRILLPMWGAMHRGENWQCGVLLSDDDGKSWRYRMVGYEPDKNIRIDPEVPAGFNEQTLFEANDEKVISLIRGRAKLGQVAESSCDTWFFRSVSEDGGETWSEPKVTNLAGTGGSSNGITLPDGSLLQACRIPYSRKLYYLPKEHLYGLHISRSFDEGKTWEPAWMAQKDPKEIPFDNYYNVMNGRFIQTDNGKWFYIFGQFDVKRDIHRILMLRIEADPN